LNTSVEIRTCKALCTNSSTVDWALNPGEDHSCELWSSNAILRCALTPTRPQWAIHEANNSAKKDLPSALTIYFNFTRVLKASTVPSGRSDPHLSCAALGFDIVGKKWVDVSEPLRENDRIRISGAWIDGEYGKPETWREVILVNPAIFTIAPAIRPLRHSAQKNRACLRLAIEHERQGDLGVGTLPESQKISVSANRPHAGGVGVRALGGSRFQSVLKRRVSRATQRPSPTT
jgi:hypothetical protein